MRSTSVYSLLDRRRIEDILEKNWSSRSPREISTLLNHVSRMKGIIPKSPLAIDLSEWDGLATVKEPTRRIKS